MNDLSDTVSTLSSLTSFNKLATTNTDSDADQFSLDFQRALTEQPHAISPKYFYDAPGSALFDQICELPEYYPTRTEASLLHTHAEEMADWAGRDAEIVEFGAGSLHKVRTLLNAFKQPARYVPIDISGEHLCKASERLRADYPTLDVRPVMGDYTCGITLPVPLVGSGKRIGFFPGSTIGNFLPHEALQFLRDSARALAGGALVLGADLVKAPSLLHAAYNDAAGVTAKFNLNLLARANRELNAGFKLDQCAHYAFYNAPHQRIEMHLVNLVKQTVQLRDREVAWMEGNSLRTEYSHKFTLEGIRDLAVRAGFQLRKSWTDTDRLFSIHWLEAPLSRD